LEGRESDDNIDDAQVDIALRRRLLVAFHKIGILRGLSLESALAEQVVHERADIEPNLRPQRLIIRLEDHPLRSTIKTFLDVESRAPHRDVFPFGREPVIALQRACSPNYSSCGWH